MDDLLKKILTDVIRQREEREEREQLPNDLRDNECPQNMDVTARALLDILPDIMRPCRFKVRDLVIPTGKGFWKKSLGVAIVSHVLSEADIITDSENRVVGRLDMVIVAKRHARNGNSMYEQFEADSSDFELYTGPIATK